MDSIAIYAHFSKQANVEQNVFHYLGELRENGFDLCFVTTSPISQDSIDRLSDMCIEIIKVENIGLDFLMWKKSIERIQLSRYHRLLLTNSSIIGPLQPLTPIFQQAQKKGHKFWGMTDNSWYCRHLQSYFLVFEQEVLDAPFFAEFWQSILPWQSKAQIIVSYEIGLSNWMAQHGYKGFAMFPEVEIWGAYRQSRTLVQLASERVRGKLTFPQNVTLEFPDILLSSGMPFLKRSILSARTLRFTPEKAKSLLQHYEGSLNPRDEHLPIA